MHSKADLATHRYATILSPPDSPHIQLTKLTLKNEKRRAWHSLRTVLTAPKVRIHHSQISCLDFLRLHLQSVVPNSADL